MVSTLNLIQDGRTKSKRRLIPMSPSYRCRPRTALRWRRLDSGVGIGIAAATASAQAIDRVSWIGNLSHCNVSWPISTTQPRSTAYARRSLTSCAPLIGTRCFLSEIKPNGSACLALLASTIRRVTNSVHEHELTSRASEPGQCRDGNDAGLPRSTAPPLGASQKVGQSPEARFPPQRRCRSVFHSAYALRTTHCRHH